MSNLTELLPAGGGGKNVNFVASGTLPSGQAVALKTDGTVTAITGQVGAATTYAAGGNSEPRVGMCFDPDSNKVVIAYRDAANSNHGYAIVGTVSGTSISFGTAVAFYSGSAINGSPAAAYDTTANKVVITYVYSNQLHAIVGTVSGTSISFGSTANISASPGYIDSVYDSSANKTLVSYSNGLNSNYPTVVAISVSGTTPSFGSQVVVVSAGVQNTSLSYDTTANKSSLVITNQSSNYFKAYVITISGTTPSAGSVTSFGTFSNGVDGLSTAYDPDINRHIVVFRDRTSGASQYFSNYIIFQISGTSIINNTAAAAFTNFNGGNPRIDYDTAANKVVVIYNNVPAGYTVEAKVGAVTTSSITFGDPITISTGTVYTFGVIYDPTANKTVVALGTVASANNDSQALVFNLTGVPNTDFIGITDADIANAASGSVTIKGGISTIKGGTYTITVVNSGSGNKYAINGVEQAVLNLYEGATYKFDQSSGTNAGHPFRFSTTADGTHGGGSEYTTGVTTSGTPGNAGAYTQLIVASGAPTLYYYCSVHSGMGGTANTLAIVPNSNYYVQADGTLTTTTSTVLAGRALSSTSINLDYTT